MRAYRAMLIDFFFELRKGGVPATIKEFLAVMEALKRHVVSGSIDEFYYLGRVCLVKDEAHFDRYDRVFGAYFQGIDHLPLDLLAQIPEANPRHVQLSSAIQRAEQRARFALPPAR